MSTEAKFPRLVSFQISKYQRCFDREKPRTKSILVGDELPNSIRGPDYNLTRSQEPKVFFREKQHFFCAAFFTRYLVFMGLLFFSGLIFFAQRCLSFCAFHHLVIFRDFVLRELWDRDDPDGGRDVVPERPGPDPRQNKIEGFGAQSRFSAKKRGSDFSSPISFHDVILRQGRGYRPTSSKVQTFFRVLQEGA